MAKKRKRNVKRRGAGRGQGWGSVKKHRGHGSKGGCGMAGTKKQNKFWVMKNMPDHLGKRGFKSLQQRSIKVSGRSIGLRDLERLAGKEKELDLRKHGYAKVLGSGDIRKAIIVKADAFTEKAKEKIEKAGGKIISDEKKKPAKEPAGNPEANEEAGEEIP
jgi:large subunit ribosomal protein L15